MNQTIAGTRAQPAFARLKNLTRNPSDLGATFEEMGKVLQKCHVKAKLQFRIADGDQVHSYNIIIGNGTSKVQAESVKNADFEVLTTSDTWWEIASGKLAPLEAFGSGLMRFRGDPQLGQRILTHLAGTEGRTQIC